VPTETPRNRLSRNGSPGSGRRITATSALPSASPAWVVRDWTKTSDEPGCSAAQRRCTVVVCRPSADQA
jgi:hypothetical protein